MGTLVLAQSQRTGFDLFDTYLEWCPVDATVRWLDHIESSLSKPEIWFDQPIASDLCDFRQGKV